MPGGKALLPRRTDWLRGQRGLRELTAATLPGGLADCSSCGGLTEGVELACASGAWDRRAETTARLSTGTGLWDQCPEQEAWEVPEFRETEKGSRVTSARWQRVASPGPPGRVQAVKRPVR